MPPSDLETVKTYWPVSHTESIFLPEFKIKPQVTENDFVVRYTSHFGLFINNALLLFYFRFIVGAFGINIALDEPDNIILFLN